MTAPIIAIIWISLCIVMVAAHHVFVTNRNRWNGEDRDDD